MSEADPRPLPDCLAEAGTLGTRRQLRARDARGAGHPFFFVQRGSIDVFLARHAGKAAEGARDFLFSVGAGQLLALPPIGHDDFALLAVVGPNTQYRVLQRDVLLQALKGGACEETAALLDALALALAPARIDKAPPACVELADGSHFVAGAEPAGLVPVPGVRWLETQAGEGQYFGLLPIPGACLALWPAETWIHAAPRSEVRACTTRHACTRGLHADMLAAVEAMVSLLSLEAVRQKQLDDIAELARLQEKSEIGGKIMSDALHEFVEIFDEEDAGGVHARDSEPLLAACRLLGPALGIAFKKPAVAGKLTVRKVAQASRVRYRLVTLKGEWWRRDGGPLLGYTDPDRAPVALLPIKGGGYRAIDPATGQATVVTSANVSTWMTYGFMFYAALPARKLTLRDILHFVLQGARKELYIVAAIALATTVLGMLIPVASGYLFDSVFPAADRQQMVQVIAILFAVNVATALLEVTRALALLRIEGRGSSSLQAAVWDRVLSLPAPFFRDYTSGDLALRINGINQIREILSGTAISTLVSSVFSALTVFVLFYYNVTLALVAVALVLVAVGFNALIGYFGVRATRETAQLNGKVIGLVFEYLSGIIKLRITGAERQAFANWAAKFASQKRAAMRAGGLNNAAAIFSATFPVLASMLIFLAISWLPASEASTFSTGDFIAFTAAFTIFLGAALALVRIGLDCVSVISIFDRVRPIFEALPEVDEDKVSPGVLEGHIELDNVGFAYAPDHVPVLKDVSIRVRPGEFVALVGSSGSGKSTLLRLMLGFERPTHGYIYYDGSDLADLDVRDVRQQIGVVLQSGKLMSGDIYSNIIGATSLTLDQAWEAARACGLDADIEAMPMGMHTLVSDGGSTLSGGQRQRLMIARALVNKPRMLFFDEATSALDNRSQAIVSASMEQLQATRIVIAHRLSTIINADRIYVLDQGMVVQSGTYQQLMEQDGLFAELAKRQLA